MKYLKSIRIIFLSLILLFHANCVFAQENRGRGSFQAQLLLSKIGPGISIGYFVTNSVFLGLESFAISFDTEDEETTDTVYHRFSSQCLTINYYFFDDIGWFIQYGWLDRRWEIEETVTDSNGDGVLSPNEEIRISVIYPETAQSIGTGFCWELKYGVFLGVDVSLILGSKPAIEADAGSNVTLGDLSSTKASVEANHHHMGNSLLFYSMSIGYQF